VAAVVTIGDSIAWGQGLPETEKFSALVTTYLRGAGLIGDGGHRMLAHSGAKIGIGLTVGPQDASGEVPLDRPTIVEQARGLAGNARQTDGVALVLLNGGINDIGVDTLLNPLTDPTQIRLRATQYCFEDMKTVLRACLDTYPRARIVLTGYYPLISEESDALLIPALAGAFSLSLVNVPGAVIAGVLSLAARKVMADNCSLFASTANKSFQRVAKEVNAELAHRGDARRVGVAVPSFGPKNAALASNAFVWGLRFTADPTELFVPVDGVIHERVQACHLAADAGRIDNYARCKIASVGHPNPAGVKAYVSAIQAVLKPWVDTGWLAPADRQEWLALVL
jgi:lysophospholipase L1-like esterase